MQRQKPHPNVKQRLMWRCGVQFGDFLPRLPFYLLEMLADGDAIVVGFGKPELSGRVSAKNAYVAGKKFARLFAKRSTCSRIHFWA